MPFALTNARVLVDGAFVGDLAVVVDGSVITKICPAAALGPGISCHDLGQLMLAPGFVDTQVNGGGGALFNAAPTVETIRTIGAAHVRYGTTGFLPTLISDSPDVIREGIYAVEAAIEAGVPGVLGIHIEGPFINTERKGIHSADRIRAFDEDDFATLTSPSRGRRLVTVAPERMPRGMIGRMVAQGVIVSAGHTNGTFTQITAAIDEGLTGFTHLFNAMSQLGNREPGAVGAALSNKDVWCGIIVDGHHVSPATLGLALRCKPIDRFMLVTDAMPTTGWHERSFDLQDERIVAEGGRLISEDGTLAGSDLDMMSAVRNAHNLLGVPLIEALAMASAVPSSFLALHHRIGKIAVGHDASFVSINDALEVVTTWVKGIATK